VQDNRRGVAAAESSDGGAVRLGHEREEEGDPDKVGPPIGERKGTGPSASETGGEGEQLGWLLGRPAYARRTREKGKVLRWAGRGELERAAGAGSGRASCGCPKSREGNEILSYF